MKKVVWGIVVALTVAILITGCGKAELEKTKAELENTKAEVAGTKTELAETKAEFLKTKAELTEIKAELNDTKKRLNEAYTKLGVIKKESKFGRYKVILLKRNTTDLDWSKGTFGSALNITMTIYKDGNKVHSVTITGKRGEHEAKVQPGSKDSCVFEIDYSSSSKYVIKYKEATLVANTKEYNWVGNDKVGNWPFGGDGRITVGNSSWFQFSAEKIK